MIEISTVIPTYGREAQLLDTIHYLLKLPRAPDEILVIDQSKSHEKATADELSRLSKEAHIRWLRLTEPSIPRAMNTGLLEASGLIVLFLDDDIIPDEHLIDAHLEAHRQGSAPVVVGRVTQPWSETKNEGGALRFDSVKRQLITDVIGCNFSVQRTFALDIGGFDENFVRVAYRFETEFAERVLADGERIIFEPSACITHLKVEEGGTRSFGDHLRTIRPSHSVGAYYYIYGSRRLENRTFKMFRRLLGSVSTRYHLRHPWWIPLTLISEVLGMTWAILLQMKGARLLDAEQTKEVIVEEESGKEVKP